MLINRRNFLVGSVGAGLAAGGGIAWGAGVGGIRVGACVVDLEQAAQAGLAGVEVNVGGPAEELRIAQPAYQEVLKRQMGSTGLPVCSLMMALLNECPLASDPRAPRWLEQAIDGASALGAKVILVAFFGNGDLLDAEGRVQAREVDEVVKRLKAAAPRASDAGVVLGIENYLNAEQNIEILERVDHEAVRVYYDVYNTGVTKGHDVPAEVRKLGSRIVQFHFKNGGEYLDAGPLDHGAIARAIRDVGFEGWVVLETSSPGGDAVADARRNGEYVRRVLGA